MGGMAGVRMPGTNSAPLRLGVVRGPEALRGWQVASLEHLTARDRAELVLLVESSALVPDFEPGAGPLARWFWRYVLRRSAALARREWTPSNNAAVTHLLAAGGALTSEQVEVARALSLDLVLDFTNQAASLALAATARLGVWTIQFGEGARGRNGPPCFWELAHGDDTVTARLEVALGNGDRKLLYQGHLKAFHISYVRTCDYLLFRAAEWPAQQAFRPRPLGASPAAAPREHAGLSWRKPGDWDVARLLWRMSRAVAATLRDTFLRAEQWHIGVIDGPIGSLLVDGPRPPVRWLPPLPSGWYIADPFGIAGTNTILAEAFHYREAKGYITALETSAFTLPVPLPSAFMDDVHLSYPYTIEDDGRLYCLPERSAANELILYRIIRYPDVWMREATILDGFPAVDASIFPFGGCWWLFCTMSERGHESTLHIWHAPALTGPWSPHPGNPVKTDVRSSRPAGRPFIWKGQLYRPAQDCSRVYGGAVTLLRVTALTTSAFAEEVVRTIGPWTASAYPDGLHTLTGWGERTLVDAKRLVFMPTALWHVVRYYLTVARTRGRSQAR